MGDQADRCRRLAAARADFLANDRVELSDVPRHVVASWRRSVSNGVLPHRLASAHHAELDLESRLVRCATPVIEQLAEQASGVPICVALTDNKAHVLSRRDSGPSIGRILDRVYFAQGFDYAESAVGTNGVGTVLEFGKSVHIVGAEHFVDKLQAFACAGAPIRNPFTGRIEGVLDLSCLSAHSSPIMHSLVRAAARQIARNLLLDRNLQQQALFDAYTRVDARSREAVLAVGPTCVVANSLAQTLLTARDQEVLRDHVRFVMARRESADDPVDLPSGSRVRVRGSTVRLGHDIAGMVAVVSPVADSAVPEQGRRGAGRCVDSTRSPRAPTESCSPAWRVASRTVESALRCGQPVLLLGEQGTGRVALLTALHQQMEPTGRVIVLEPAEVDAAPTELAARLRRGGSGPVLHVLRNIDQVSGTTGEILAAAVRADPVGHRLIAATATEASAANPALGPILAMFRTSATVPALRHRGSDLDALAAALLATLAPRRDIRLTRGALTVLARYSWPGNVEELKKALRVAVAHRPVGMIGAQDLPAFCQSTPRRALRPVDEVERDAIVAALRAVDGNRVAAAAALGFARSTLYRKIRQYGIVD